MEIKEENTLAYSIYEQLRNALTTEKKVFFAIGELLKRLNDEKLYRYIGDGGYDNFTQFLAAPEINITKSRAYFYMRIYEFYIEKMALNEGQLKDLSAYKLFRLLPFARTKTKPEVIQLIDEVRELGVGDTEAIIQQRQPPSDRPQVYACPSCGKWIVKYHETSLCADDDYLHLINLDLK